MYCAARDTLGRGADLVSGVAQLPFDQVLVTLLTGTGGTKAAPETVLPEKPNVFTYVHCPPDAPPVQTIQGKTPQNTNKFIKICVNDLLTNRRQIPRIATPDR